jgi:hypothetical protein
MECPWSAHVGWPSLEPVWWHAWHHNCVVGQPSLLQPALAASKSEDQAVVLDSLQTKAAEGPGNGVHV